jgi:ribose-phosphate pyrophosphokinase
MKILNLANLAKSEIKYTIQEYQDSQKNIIIDENSIDNVIIYSRMQWSDLQLIIVAVNALQNINPDVRLELYVPFFLGGRSDRAFTNKGVRYLSQIIAPIINALEFKKVHTLDPHSSVMENVINNLQPIFFLDVVLFNKDHCQIVFPDEGAKKRYASLNLNAALCVKDRDGDNVTVQFINQKLKGKNFVVIDDICDGGRTFAETAKHIKSIIPDAEIDLIIPIGMFNYGFEVLKDYNRVITTNAYREFSNKEINNGFVNLQIKEVL